MKILGKKLTVMALGLMLAGIVQAGDMDGAVAYSMGEFDRVGASQPVPKVQATKGTDTKKVASRTQSVQDRELAVRKAEFVRRMFWLALSAR